MIAPGKAHYYKGFGSGKSRAQPFTNCHPSSDHTIDKILHHHLFRPAPIISGIEPVCHAEAGFLSGNNTALSGADRDVTHEVSIFEISRTKRKRTQAAEKQGSKNDAFVRARTRCVAFQPIIASRKKCPYWSSTRRDTHTKGEAIPALAFEL
jgi:hypothetical protein